VSAIDSAFLEPHSPLSHYHANAKRPHRDV